MARTRPVVVVVARPRSDVYVGMLALSALATAAGCLLLALELTTYDWETAAKKGPTATVPADLAPKRGAAAGTPAAAPTPGQ